MGKKAICKVDSRIGVMTSAEKTYLRDKRRKEGLRKNIAPAKYIEWRFQKISEYRAKRGIPMPEVSHDQ